MKGLTTPPGFQRKFAKGRQVFTTSDPAILLEHESLVQSLLAEGGEKKCTMPDQFDCIRPHLHHRFMLKLDLHNAFGSLSAFGVSVVLRLDDEFDCNWRCYFHPEGGLIQGAPASPILFHLYMKEWVEPELAKLCTALGLVWTRYIDDFLFSSHSFIDASTQKKLRDFLRSKGFRLNTKKTRAIDLHKEPLTHLGMVLSRDKVDVTDDFKAKLRACAQGSPKHKQLLRWRERVLAWSKK